MNEIDYPSYRNKINRVENTAYTILKDHKLYSIPVDPVILANNLGIKVKNAVFSEAGISGMISKRKDITTILVNQNDTPFRKRFTIAHELGHYLLHLSDDGEFVDNNVDLFRDIELESDGKISNRKISEVEANKFAASLLMPEEHLRNLYSKNKDLKYLAQYFNVSEQAMAYRINQLRLN